MSDLVASVMFTKNGNQPATGLTLAEINLYLTAVNKSTGAETIIWDGTQNPTAEISNVGAYIRLYTADFDTYVYIAAANYTGAEVLDSDWVGGSAAAVATFEERSISAIAFTYTVTVSGNPLPGATVWITTDVAGANAIWEGTTDAFGIALDVNDEKPFLDPGTYYFWTQLEGYSFTNPDTEVVS